MRSAATIVTGLVLAAASAAPAAVLFDVNFDANNVGDNYTSVGGVGTNTNLIGALPNNLTSARAAGDYSATVDASHKLIFTATGTANGSEGFQVFAPQGAPASPETWFIQFDYTRLATSGFIIGMNFLNNSGQNMLGHPNNFTIYTDSFGGDNSYPGAAMAVGSTYTLRLEIDSGTSTMRAYSNGVQLIKAGVPLNIGAVNTSGGFGGIDFHVIAVNPTDFNVDNISGGIVDVPEPMSLSLLGLGVSGLLMRRKQN